MRAQNIPISERIFGGEGGGGGCSDWWDVATNYVSNVNYFPLTKKGLQLDKTLINSNNFEKCVRMSAGRRMISISTVWTI